VKFPTDMSRKLEDGNKVKIWIDLALDNNKILNEDIICYILYLNIKKKRGVR